MMTKDGLITGGDLFKILEADGLTRLEHCRNQDANDLFYEELMESSPYGCSWGEHILNCALRQDYMGLMKSVRLCAEAAGNREACADLLENEALYWEE